MLSYRIDDDDIDAADGAEQSVQWRLSEPTAIPRPLRASQNDVCDAVFADGVGHGTGEILPV